MRRDRVISACVAGFVAVSFGACTSDAPDKVPTSPISQRSKPAVPLHNEGLMTARPLAAPHAAWLTPERAAAFAAFRARPEFQAKVAEMKRINARGRLAIAVIDQPLPSGVSGLVRLNQHGEQGQRYIIVSSRNFDDDIYLRLQMYAFAYQMQHEDDDSPVTLTAYDNGTVEYSSQKAGHGTAAHWEKGHVSGKNEISSSILRRADAMPKHYIPGFNAARVVQP